MIADKKILNKEQLQAIKHGKGPLLIIAGAGTGKTTVITERVKYLISKELAKPSEILALTFTEKAALEMEERVDEIMPYGYTQMWISTFHSFCDRVLRDEAIHIGLDSHYVLMTEAETLMFFKKHLFDFKLDYFRPAGNPTKFLYDLLTHFNRLKDEDISPKEYLLWAQAQNSLAALAAGRQAGRQAAGQAKLKPLSQAFGPSSYRGAQVEGTQSSKEKKDELKKNLELAKAYQKYEELKIKEGVMDFADLISNTLKLFRIRKNVLNQYRKKFKYILVDEFQDTNIAQNELVILLVGKKANLTVVADDDQSIYKWRGAAVSNVLQFRKTYPKAKIITLTKNYRSTQEILNRAYDLIQNNNPDRLEVKEKINKKLISVRDKILPADRQGIKIQLIKADRVENEAETVAKEIKRLIFSAPGAYNFGDIAILVRANNHADAFVRSFLRQGIPFQFLGPGKLFRQEEVKNLIAYLKVLYNFEDNVAFFKILSMPIFDISARDIAAIRNFAKKKNLSFFEAAEKNEQILLTQNSQEKIEKLVKMIHSHLKLIPKETAGQILYYFLEDSGLLKQLTEYKTEKEEQIANNIATFFDKLRAYEVEHEDASVETVVDWINLKMEMGESPLATDIDWTQENKVNILTVHSSKGLEFSVVFLVNLVNERFPTRERKEQIPIPDKLIKEALPEGDSHEQEERRLFYVGMTRTKDLLYFSAADFYGEGKRMKKISPFVHEALGKSVASCQLPVASNQLSIFDFKPSKDLPTTNYQLPTTKINYISYSQLETFKKCPLQYKYKYILRIPVPPSAAASFGTSIHTVLKGFYQQVMEGKRPNKNDLFNLLNKSWLLEGYASKQHESRMKKRAKELLEIYYKKTHDEKATPFALEQVFAIKISPELKIGGKIDRVDQLPDGSLEIIDYKTGKVPSKKEVDKDLQMTVYAMAACNPAIFAKDPEKVTLSFYFFENQEKMSTKRSREDLEKAKEEILTKAKEIGGSDFLPTPSKICDFCEYKLLCPAWQ